MNNFYTSAPTSLVDVGCLAGTIARKAKLIFAALICLQGLAMAQTTVTLTANRDANIWNNNAGDELKNYGSCDKLYINGPSGTAKDRPLIGFDLSSIPSNAVVTSATFTLIKIGLNNTSISTSVHRLTADWTEGTGGCAGSTGVANWQQRVSGTPWTTPGGDFNSTAEATINVAGNGTYNWTVTNLVQGWVNGTFPNYGLIAKYTTENTNAEKEFGASENGTAADRPKLTVTYYLPPTLSTSVTNVNCNGASNGSINLTVTGGNPPFTFLWSNSATTEDISGLAAGTYTVTVTNTGSGSATASVTVTQPAVLNATATPTPVTCNGGSDGTITFSAPSGGSGAYEYRLNAGAWQSSPTFTGLAPFNYVIWIRDANNPTCIVSLGNSQVTQPAVLNATVAKTNVTCNGANNGTITLSAPTGGSGSYQYRLNTGVWQSGTSFTGLAPGTYSVQIRDANATSCVITLGNQTITQPTAVSGTINSQTNVLCFGGSTGAISVSGNGGTAPYTYRLDAGAYGSSGTFTGIAAGAHTVTVRDANLCTFVVNFTITQPSAALAVTSALTQPQCFTFGSIAITASGGTSPYTYDWSDVPGASNPEDRTGLSAGTYTVTVTDANGCTVSSGALVLNAPINCAPVQICRSNAASVFSVAPDPANTSYTWTVPANAVIVSGQGTSQIVVNWNAVTPGAYQVCVVANNACGTSAQTCQNVSILGNPTPTASAGPACTGGTIQLFATGGQTYNWAGPGGFTSNSANPIIVNASAASHNGTYTVTVTSVAGCSATATAVVTVSARPTLSVVNTNNAACGQNTGSIDLSVSGGTPGYTYLWSNNATTQDLSSLFSGAYTVTVTDAAGCTQSTATSLSDLPGPTVTATQTNISCAGGSNGAINATITGGTPPYTRLWSNGATTEDLSGIPADDYSLTVTDANGCVGVLAVTLTQPTAITLDFTQVNVSCFGGATGSINLNVSGGTGVYSYSWTKNGSPFGGNTQDLSGLGFGVYAVTVTDANSCTKTTSVTITQPAAALSVSPAITNVSCNGGSNGQVILTVTGGTLPYSYAWAGPAAFSATTKDISGRVAGTYSVTVTDGNGCTSALTSISITQPAVLNVSAAVPTAVKCFGGSDGSINVTIAGGTNPYTYLWSNGATVEDPSGLTTGAYTVTVTDSKGCTTASGSITVGQPAAALTATPSITNVSCNGAATGSVSLSVNGGTPNYTYLWSNSAVTANITNVAAGNYTVTVTDANLCTVVQNAVINQPSAIAITEFITNAACNGSSTGAINMTVSGGNTPYTYNWGGGITTEDRTNLSAGTYTVTVTDGNLCTATKMFTVGQPAVLAATGTQVNVSCNGGANASVNLTVTGGTSPFTFAWTNGANTEDVSSLVAGTYTVTVTDFNLCTATQSFTITEPATLSFTNTVTPNCAAQSNGSIALTISGGTGPFTYTWTGAGSGTNPRTGLAAGMYAVTVTDAQNCTTTGSFELVPLTVDVVGFNGTCIGGPNGQVFAVATGGLTPYTYLWSNNATTNVVNGLTGGTYTVTVTAGACTASDFVVLVDPTCLPPVAVDDQYVTAINTPVSGTVRANDTDPVYATNTLNVEPVTTLDPSIGVIVWDPSDNGNFTFTPAANFVGVVNIDYQICNPAALCDNGVLTIIVNNTIAQNDINQTPINTVATGNVLTNDSDLQGDTQTVTSAQADTDGDGQVDDALPLGVGTTIYGPNNNAVVVVAGTVILNANGNYTYTPALNFTGNAPFAYTITDNSAAPVSDNATVNIEVIPTSVPGVNEPPVANDDTNTTEQDVNVSGNVLTNDSDPDGDVITVTSSLADTNGDGLANENLPVGVPTFIFGTNLGGNVVLAGEMTLNANGTYTFNPQPTFTGDVPVRYTISDPLGLTDNAILTITVIPNLGNATFANDDANSGPQGVVQTGNVLTNDSDPEGNTQTVTAAVNSANTALVVNGVTANALPSGGTLVLAANGAYTYTPAANFTGTEIIRYTATDNGSPAATDVATLYLTTLPINNTLAQNDINQTPVNTPVGGNVLTNDSDPQGNTQTVTSALADTDGDGSVDDNLPLGSSTTVYGTNNANMVVVAGTVTLNANGTYTYTPAANYQGTVPFVYTITDNNLSPATASATVAIEVIPTSVPGVNEPPVANDDTNTTEQDVNVSGFVLPNDSDPDGDVITVTSALADTDGDGQVDDPLTLGAPTPIRGTNASGVTVPAGTITLNANGTYTFDPLPTFTGNVPVRYTISDPLGLTDNAVLTITVIPNLGNSTFANDDANSGAQGVVQTGNVLTNDSDPEGNIQTVTAAVNSANTALVVNGVTANALPSGGTLVLAANGAYTYTPAANFTGTEIIRYTATDNGSPAATDVATLYLTTLPINNTLAQNDINQTPVNTPVSGNVLTNDNDPQGNTQTVTSALADTDGDGQVDDNLPLGSSTTVYGTNNANMVVVAGTVTLNANGTYTYTPAANYQGTVPFAYTITDNNLSPATASATVAIEVIPTSVPGVNEPPVANDDTNTTEQDVNVSGFVLPNDSDPDGDVITVTTALADTDGDGQVDDPLTLGTPTPVNGTNASGVAVPAGTITLNSNGTYTFDPLPTFIGNVPVQYTISDPLGLTDNAVLAITVIPNLGNVTFANDDANSGAQGAVQTGNILTNDFDPEGNTQTVTAAVNSANTALVVNGVTANTLPSGGTLILAANGAYTYTPAANFTGTEIIRYTVTDNGSPVDTDVATLYLTTLPINNTLAQNDINQTPVNTPVGGNVLTNDSDPQGNTQTVTSALADTDGDGSVDDNLPLGVNTTVYGTNNANTVVVAGTVTLNANGTYTYTPAANYQGTVPFAYTITDNNLSPATASATVAIEVIPAPVPGNEPPVANDDTNTTEQDVNVSGFVLPNDSDPDGDVITVTSALADTDGDGQVDDPLTLGAPTPIRGTNASGVTVPAGTITLNSNGTYTFDPLPTFIGNVPVQYTISDPGSLTDNAVLTITVIPNLGNTTFANDDANSGIQGVVQTGNIQTNDFDPEGNTQTVTAAVSSTNTALVVNGVTANVLPSGGTLVLAANGAYTYTPAANFAGTEIIRYTATDNGLPVATDVATLYLTTLADSTAKLKLKVFLQGALYGTSNGLMRDDLRSGGHIPLTEPYTALGVGNARFTHKGGGGGETTTLAVLNANAGTPNAIVDWVFVELRNSLDSSVVAITRSALLQRDGDVVSPTDGTSMVTFPGQVGKNYFVSVKHRNHLGAMLSSSVLMKNDSTVVDFINPTNTQLYNRPGSINYDGSEMVTVLTNKKALWAGNAQPNNKVKYQGVGSDNNPMLAQVLGFPGNTSGFYNYNLAFGYFTGDINMDGKVKYQGPGNDATFIFTNVVGLYSTLNTASLYNYDLFIEQLP